MVMNVNYDLQSDPQLWKADANIWIRWPNRDIYIPGYPLWRGTTGAAAALAAPGCSLCSAEGANSQKPRISIA